MKIEIPMLLNQKEEIFTHKDDDGTFRHFPIRIMREVAHTYGKVCPQILTVRLPLRGEITSFIREKMGIEEERIERLREPYLSEPIIGILWEDNQTMTIIDGNHRYVKLYESCHKRANFFVFKFPFWEQFCLPMESDEELLSRRSMMIEYEQEKDVYDGRG